MECLSAREADGKRGQAVKWTPRMEEAYEAALEKLGGLEHAKPKAVMELLLGAPGFEHITIHNVKWHLAAHRRRAERHKLMVPANITPPTKWCGRLEEAYEAAVARQGGLHSARPKALLEALQPEFPELTLQIVKWHLQSQRRAKQRKVQAAAATSGAAGQLGSAQTAAGEIASHGEAGTPARASSLSGAASSGGATFHATAVQQGQRQQRPGAPAGELELLAEQLGLGPPVLQRRQQLQQQQAARWQLPEAAWQQQPQPQQHAAQQGPQQQQQQLQWPPQPSFMPWQAHLPLAADGLLSRTQLSVKLCRQVVASLERQAERLAEIVACLAARRPPEGPAWEALSRLLVQNKGGPVLADESVLDGLLAELMMMMAAGQERRCGGGASASVSVSQPCYAAQAEAALPASLQRQQRIVAALAAAFPPSAEGSGRSSSGGGSAGLAAALAGALQGGSGICVGAAPPVHDAATCTTPGCLRCKYEARVQRMQQQQAAAQAARQHAH
ncbi:hypothetical protein ABPG75_011429 [Micractinium tetrahymenae]